MNYFAISLTLILAVSLVVTPIEVNLDGTTFQLSLVGWVDGKSYFADGNTTLSWFRALEVCESVNMRLATITTLDQRSFLARVSSNQTLSGLFWVAGQDRYSSDQFFWRGLESNENSLNSSWINIDFSAVAYTYMQCLSFNATNDGYNRFLAQLCEDSRRTGVLCENVL